MAGKRRDRDDLPRKPKRTRPQPDAPEASEPYDDWCHGCQDETEHQEGECVPCSAGVGGPRGGPG